MTTIKESFKQVLNCYNNGQRYYNNRSINDVIDEYLCDMFQKGSHEKIKENSTWFAKTFRGLYASPKTHKIMLNQLFNKTYKRLKLDNIDKAETIFFLVSYNVPVSKECIAHFSNMDNLDTKTQDYILKTISEINKRKDKTIYEPFLTKFTNKTEPQKPLPPKTLNNSQYVQQKLFEL